MVLPILLSYILTPADDVIAIAFVHFYFLLKCKRPVSAMAKASKAKPNSAVKRFEAQLERMRSRLNWVIIHIPFDAAKVWGLRGQIRVKGNVNNFAFRSSLFPTGYGRHLLLVNKRMQRGANAVAGSVASFTLELDSEERRVIIPDELTRVLGGMSSGSGTFRRWYEGLNHSTRNDIAKWIGEPKSSAARVRRSEQIAERLLAVMDAEKDLPPVLQIAFARHPRARDGWNQMSLSRRRGHLLGIFYYRTPEAQARRIGKMLDDAAALAEKIGGKGGKE
jgi:uncharacterized protein YdeI (YjbR/CyaY-like superfamily)